jgi:tetrahydromethanopterin S-methyltransferase subunit G
MSTGDRITILAAAGAVSATLGVGACSTNARIGDVITQVNSRIDDVNGRFDDVYRRFDAINGRFDDVYRRFDAIDRRFDAVDQRLDAVDGRLYDLQVEVREMRALIVANPRNAPGN